MTTLELTRADRMALLNGIFRNGYLLREDVFQCNYEYRIQVYEYEGYIYYLRRSNDRVTDIVKLCRV